MDENASVSVASISKGTMNSDTYLNECIRKCLIPFVRNGHVLIWTDMDSCHNTKCVADYLKPKNVEFLEKTHNAPNVSHTRPIETFW